MKITSQQLKEVCKIGQGNECCRYITVGPQGIECAKNTGLKITLDQKVNNGEMVAQGDNCEGLDDFSSTNNFKGPEHYREFHESRDELQELPNDFKGR